MQKYNRQLKLKNIIVDSKIIILCIIVIATSIIFKNVKCFNFDLENLLEPQL